jgi:rhodanese-related sulfurtransferase
LELCRAGLLVGPSSGFALAGLLSFLRKSTFDEKKEMVAVFICPDSPLPYLDEYFANLDSSVFPEIENVQLLQREEVAEEVKMQTIGVVECSPQEVFNMVFTDNSLKVWSQLKQGKKIKLKKSMVVVDVRDAGDFADHHIPGSINVPFHDLDTYLKKYRRQLKNQTNLVFVCQRGHKSRLACHKANMLGLKSCSMRGGDIEWSALNLPRWRNENCVIKYKL